MFPHHICVLEPCLECILLQKFIFQIIIYRNISQPNEIFQGGEERGSSCKTGTDQKEEEEGKVGHWRGVGFLIYPYNFKASGQH